MTCKKATRLTSEALDRRLGLLERAAIAWHLVACGACRAYRQQVAGLEALVRGRGGRGLGLPRLSAGARERIREAVARAQ